MPINVPAFNAREAVRELLLHDAVNGKVDPVPICVPAFKAIDAVVEYEDETVGEPGAYDAEIVLLLHDEVNGNVDPVPIGVPALNAYDAEIEYDAEDTDDKVTSFISYHIFPIFGLPGADGDTSNVLLPVILLTPILTSVVAPTYGTKFEEPDI